MLKEISSVASSMFKMLCLWWVAGGDKAPNVHSTIRTLESHFVVLTLV